MTRFRPCIDLRNGHVTQIVGGSLRDDAEPESHFVTDEDAASFAERYRADDLPGGHVIKLGPGNDGAARRALAAWPDALQLGGGVDFDNAAGWLEAGAAKVIVTSWLMVDGRLSMDRLRQLAERIGPERLVLDLSCRRVADGWRVGADRWQTITETAVEAATLEALAGHCSEFLIHAADVEGRRAGIDEQLVAALGRWSPLPCTYAGGATSLDDLDRVAELSDGRVDLTIGSALDIFGGTLRYADCVAWNRRRA